MTWLFSSPLFKLIHIIYNIIINYVTVLPGWYTLIQSTDSLVFLSDLKDDLFFYLFQDIIETGKTMKALVSKIKDKKPRMVKVVRHKDIATN